jgi:hypothetical protein
MTWFAIVAHPDRRAEAVGPFSDEDSADFWAIHDTDTDCKYIVVRGEPLLFASGLCLDVTDPEDYSV